MRQRWAAPIIFLAVSVLGAGSARGQSGSAPASTYGTTSIGSTTASTAPGLQPQSPYSGSVPDKLEPGIIHLSLREAINRGLKQNLGLLLSSEDVRSARGVRWQRLSALLPNLTATGYSAASQINLAEEGLHIPIIPRIIGPFGYFDTRAYLTQSLFDWKAVNQTRSADRSLQSAQYSYKDARDLVILSVGYAYLQAIADQARVETAEAQVKTGQALYNQASDQVKAGTSPAIDALRNNVELQTREQQLIAARNDFAIQKLALARVIGLAPGQEFDLTERSVYEPLAALTVDEALKRAYASRSDYQAALANVRAAEYSRRAAVAGYFPTLDFDADYGAAGVNPNHSHGVMDVRGTLTVPIFQGGRVHGDILAADAALASSREKLENLRGQIDSDVRTVLFDLESTAEQVRVAESNVNLAEQTLTQSRDRFAAGVTDTVEVVQAQEAVASAHETYISSLYGYNFAKISLARALGLAEEGVQQYFKGN